MDEIRKTKAQINVWILIYILVIITIITLIFFLVKGNGKGYYDYYSAKEEAIKFLKNNINDLETNCNRLLEDKPEKCVKYEERYYCYDILNKKEYIEIDINAQGFLGGQYWGLIYSKDNLLDNEDINIEQTKTANNIFIKAKIQNNWYFYYNDYDGHININDIK